jgi:hypothetical protein
MKFLEKFKNWRNNMYDIYNVNDESWNINLSKFPIDFQDIYFSSEYYKMHQENKDGNAKLFCFKDGIGNIAIYPFLLNKINCNLDAEFYDIETAYGYGGPISNTVNQEFLSDFEETFIEYCNLNNIIAEFIRFHPLIENQNIFKKNIKIISDRKTIYLDLSKGIEAIWNEDIKSKNRNLIRKAIKNGLYVEKSTDFEAFKRIYYNTMDKVDARKHYYFNDEYFENVMVNDSNSLLVVKRENKTVAAAIFMIYGKYFHYHLAGSLKEELKYSPNNLLLWEAINYAIKNGCKIMHFGGGLSDNPEDSLFKFKSSFSKNFANFYIGKRVHNRKIYDFLIAKWENENNKKASLFLQYKY